MKRDEAIALLKKIAEKDRFTFKWISLVNGKAGCEIHIKPEQHSPAILKPLFEKHGLTLKEVEGLLIVYREHNE
jgi:hypothetical protein